MSILLLVFQVLLALHTLMGAVWKLSNSEQTVPTLKAIPHGAWLGLSAIEMLCTVVLLLSLFAKPVGRLAPVAALCIAAEMLLFSGLHVSSGPTEYGSMVYWLVVAGFCAFIAYGRLVLKPL